MTILDYSISTLLFTKTSVNTTKKALIKYFLIWLNMNLVTFNYFHLPVVALINGTSQLSTKPPILISLSWVVLVIHFSESDALFS